MKGYPLTAVALLGAVLAAPAAAQDSRKALEVRHGAKVGPYLVDGDGRAVYLFTADRQGKGSEAARSTCYDACATAWPPLTAKNLPKAGEAVDRGLLSTTKRKGDETQVTYNGWPLYHFVADEGQGQATGQDVKQFGGEWYLVTPAGHEAHAKEAGSGDQPPAQAAFAEMAFEGPECVRYDAQHDRYLVSNINGQMLVADDNGFVSRLAPDGSEQELKWISADQDGVTLNAPKGMAIANGTLHVVDIDHLRTFDVESGKPLDSLEIEGAKFLNDIAVASDGTRYVTDSGTKDIPGAIYEVSSDKIRTIAEGRDLHRPNGIDFDKDGNLIVVTFGADKVLKIARHGEILETKTLDAGQLDGLVVQDDGSRLVSSWKGKNVLRLAPDGSSETILTGVRTPACFDVDTKRQQVLVPLVRENRVVASPLG